MTEDRLKKTTKNKYLQSYVAEFIGTFVLVFAGCGAIIVNEITGSLTHLGIALTFAFVVMAMVYTFGSISGAHINPAVTIAFVLTKNFPKNRLIQYIISQLLGATFASLLLLFLFGDIAKLGATIPAGGWVQSFILEMIMTFFLMIVIMAVATDRRVPQQISGLAIGLTVGFCALFGGPISGASLNPARSFGPALLSGDMQYMLVYGPSTILGAILAAVTFSYVKTGENPAGNNKGEKDIYGVIGPVQTKHGEIINN